MQTVREIMSTNIAHVTPEDNVYEAATTMREHNIGMVPVMDNGSLLGVITDRDIVLRSVADRKPNSSRVSEIMTNQLVYGTPDMTVEEAARIMAEGQVRRLPIVENSQVIGMISLGDLALSPENAQQAEVALSEISETHHPDVSSDVELR